MAGGAKSTTGIFDPQVLRASTIVMRVMAACAFNLGVADTIQGQCSNFTTSCRVQPTIVNVGHRDGMVGTQIVFGSDNGAHSKGGQNISRPGGNPTVIIDGHRAIMAAQAQF